MAIRVPMASPDISDAEVQAVVETLRTPTLSIGPRLEAFERAAAAVAGVEWGIGVNSGTSGLHLCIIAAGVGDGDMVITTPFSFIASANCILYERGVPVFVDVDPATGNIDPHLVSSAVADLTRGGVSADRWLPPALRGIRRPAGRLRALLPVHAFGQPADMDLLLDTARNADLVVIEDACEAIGAAYKGRPAGSLRRCSRLCLLSEQTGHHRRGRHGRDQPRTMGASVAQSAQSGA